MSDAQPVYLVKGDDRTLVRRALGSLVSDLVGEGRPELIVEEVPEDADISSVLDAVQTPSFLADQRVIVVNEAGRFRADAVDPLVAYLKAPMPGASLVLVAGGGAMPTRLANAIKEHGRVVNAGVPGGRGRQAWIEARLKESPVHLDRHAAELLGESLGEELGLIDGILDALVAAYGEGSTVTADELEPFLGSAGAAMPWELTDAIDGGDTPTALVQLRRMLEGGRRHPLVVMATLQRHVSALLWLDGAEVGSEGEAAALLGIAPYAAKKAMMQARRLGRPAIARAVQLVARADVDLRGASAWPPDLVLEVLVARLSRLTRFRSR